MKKDRLNDIATHFNDGGRKDKKNDHPLQSEEYKLQYIPSYSRKRWLIFGQQCLVNLHIKNIIGAGGGYPRL